MAPVLLLAVMVPVLAQERPASTSTTKKAPVATTSAPKSAPAKNIRDCGTDQDCLIEASRNCTPAKATIARSIELVEEKQTTITYVEIRRAPEPTKCIYYYRLGKTDLTFPPNVPAEVVNENKEIYKKLEGKWASCKFATSDLTAMLIRWKNGSLSTEDLNRENCEGTAPLGSGPVEISPPAAASKSPAKAAAKAATKRPARVSSRPPRELHLVADHWTAWFPPDPATYPPNAKTYTIKAGDTLSGIAQQQYGNAYLWPQLWEANTWITDAHWIYPGDVLLVVGETSAAAVGTQTTTTAGVTAGTTGTTAGGRTLTGGQAMTRAAEQGAQQIGITAAEIPREHPPVPLGAEVDVYCYGYIGNPNEPMPNTVASFEDSEVRSEPSPYMGSQTGGSSGDLIFVNGGTATGLTAGETYMLIEPGDLIVHPRTGQTIGQHYNYQGQLRILCAEETRSRAMITQNCREIHLGARLKPMPQLPIPIARIPDTPGFCDSPTGRSAGYIIDSQDWDLGLGEGNLVQVNLGHDDQIQPGDFLTVYRDSDIPGQPRQVLGEIGILTTQSHTATGKIVGMRRAMQVGDSVEAR